MGAYPAMVTFTGSRRPILPLMVSIGDSPREIEDAIRNHVWPSVLGDIEVLLDPVTGTGRVVSGRRTVARFVIETAVAA